MRRTPGFTQRVFCLILLLLATRTTAAQERDTRAPLKGRQTGLTVSQNGTLWLTTAIKQIYYCERFGEDWHDGLSRFGEDIPEHARLRWFDQSRGILVGRDGATAKNKYQAQGYYYRTEDGGQSWQRHNYGKGFWVKDVYVDAAGNAWIVGGSTGFAYSGDYGKTWRRVQLPSAGSLGFSSIHMINPVEGIVAVRSYGLYQTAENWKTHSKVDTPLDQNAYTEGDVYGDRIEKVRMWGDYLVVSQGGKIFWTVRHPINWQPFPTRTLDYEVDRESGKLFAVDKAGFILEFETPERFSYLNNSPLKARPRVMVADGGVLHIIDSHSHINRVSANSFSRSRPLTTDHPLRGPYEALKGEGRYWGTTYSGDLLLSDDKGESWYRVDTLDFRLEHAYLLDDDTALLWDGGKKHYRYSVSTREMSPYKLNEPLRALLSAPIEELKIRAGSTGCFHCYEDTVTFKLKRYLFGSKSNTLQTSRIVKGNYLDSKKREKSIKIKKEIDGSLLTKILANVDAHPYQIPTLEDFVIEDEHVRAYLESVERRFSEDYFGYPINGFEDKAFYLSIPKKLDRLEPNIIESMLLGRSAMFSTTTFHCQVEIKNKKGVVLRARSIYSEDPPAWNLPWACEINGVQFNCYSLEFSRFIADCIPDGFASKAQFDNGPLIMNIANYLLRREREGH